MTSPDRDDSLIRIGPDQAERRLVLLHGWGADADDLLDLGELLVGAGVSVVALQAPHRHPSGSGRQWYDLQEPGWPQLIGARNALRARLEALSQSVPMEATALLGFSQGAAMALDVSTGGDASPLSLASLIVCSGYPHPGWVPQRSDTPILLTHGVKDEVVPVEASEALERDLLDAGASVKRITFAGGHCIDPALLPLLKGFLATGWQG